LLALAVYVVAPQLGDFRSSWQLLRQPHLGWVAAAVSLTLATYLAAALTYCFLSFKPLPYATTVLVQFAAMFVNRLLPGGIGALGANYAYLRKRYNRLQAGSLVAMNNLLGMIGHGLWLIILVVFSSVAFLPAYHRSADNAFKVALIVLLSIIAAALFLRWPKLKTRLSAVIMQLAEYRREGWRLPAAVSSSMALTIANVLALGACALALDVHLPLTSIFLIFTFGVGAGAATPTPGGLGGFEAGLAAGFVAYRISSPTALAIALLYRLISYWLPLVLGAVAFIVCEKRGLFQSD